MVNRTLEFYIDKEVEFDNLPQKLLSLGYKRQDQVATHGDFSCRGGVIDIFPVHFSLPVRISLADETVEGIHTFDPASGKRLEPHRMVIILPLGAGKHRLADLDAIDSFVDIEVGDLVVHTLHGIARYRGIKAIPDPNKQKKDHFVLEYADKDLLYVPSEDLCFVQRYLAFGKVKPELSKLGSKGWQKIKERTQKAVVSFASELIEIQAKRRLLERPAFEKDSAWQKKLEESFPYQETVDQESAIAKVKEDLESKMPMDRLLCGDVGYGKTEVALRAAFKVVMGGKQAAILVPTTLLAEQHFETFENRMQPFPVKISMLSRFQTKREQSEIVQAIKTGECDIVIGTHRLLSSDVAFKDLGLVIVDEEQRFGVRHKEKLKSLRLLVDVLTLTATPIPRTLYLSLVGARDISTINTPPTGRKPIETVVTEKNPDIIRQAIVKELERKGQIFFIHNRVQSIEKVAKQLNQLVPEARIGVGHGQMPAKLLESVMKKFIHGEMDVLVSTTIVESGIDIPNANTLIIDRADLFGLSELYQLRGRVGRFDRNAYAYLLLPKGIVLAHEAERRLSAIERFTHLGSGFNLAMEDLEIRGAGNILGTEQHGTITSVGFDLYCRLLKQTIDHLKRK